LLHTLSFKGVVSYVEVEEFFLFGCGIFLLVVFFFFLAGGGKKVNKSGNREVSKREIIFRVF